MIIPLYIPGHWELIVIAVVIILLFGGRKIPEMMRGLGTGIREFKKGVRDDDDKPKSIKDKEDDTKEKTKE